MAHTELFYVRLKYSFERNIRGEKLWLACLIDRSVEDVKKRITDFLSTMIIVYSLFCVFAVSDINTPINTDDVILTTFLVNASVETFVMLSLLSSSSTMYFYVVLMPDDMDTLIHFIRRFNYWISWFPLYGMLFCIILQIINIVLRLYILSPTLMISQTAISGLFLISVLSSILRMSYYTHRAFNDKIVRCLTNRVMPG
jgi:hypothetical protein